MYNAIKYIDGKFNRVSHLVMMLACNKMSTSYATLFEVFLTSLTIKMNLL